MRVSKAKRADGEYEHKLGPGHRVAHIVAEAVVHSGAVAVDKMAAGHMVAESVAGSIDSVTPVLDTETVDMETEGVALVAAAQAYCTRTVPGDMVTLFQMRLDLTVGYMVIVAAAEIQAEEA